MEDGHSEASRDGGRAWGAGGVVRPVPGIPIVTNGFDVRGKPYPARHVSSEQPDCEACSASPAQFARPTGTPSDESGRADPDARRSPV